MSPGLTQLFVCVYWFGIFLEINVLRRVELWPWLWYHPCWFSTTKNTTDPCCRCCSWKCRWFYLLKFYGEQSSQCDDDDDVILLLSAYLVIFLCIFRVQLSHDNGDKCMSISWNLINEVTRIRHQFIEGSSHNDQCFLLVWGYFINLKLVISAPGWNQAHCVDRGVEQTASNSTDWSNSQHCLLHQNGNPAGSSYDTT